MVWPCPCPVSDSPSTGPPLTLLIKHDLNAPVYILPPSTRPNSCNGHRKVSNALPEPNRSCPTRTAILLLFPIGCVPFFSACSVLFPALRLSHAVVCAATELSVRCSQDLFDLWTFSVLSPDRRGEPVVTHTRHPQTFKIVQIFHIVRASDILGSPDTHNSSDILDAQRFLPHSLALIFNL